MARTARTMTSSKDDLMYGTLSQRDLAVRASAQPAHRPDGSITRQPDAVIDGPACLVPGQK